MKTLFDGILFAGFITFILVPVIMLILWLIYMYIVHGEVVQL